VCREGQFVYVLSNSLLNLTKHLQFEFFRVGWLESMFCTLLGDSA
jgi:hypothetical protein